MDIASAIPMIEFFMDKDHPVFIWGKPGVGKSSIVKQIADKRSLPLIDFRALLRDPVDLRGLPVADLEHGKAIWLAPADLPDEVRHGKNGVLLMDELNAAPPMVQAACFSLVLDRKVGEYVMPPGWRIIAAGNRQKDRAAAQKMPSALANRFRHITIDTSAEAWDAWASRNGIHPLVRAFIKFKPGQLSTDIAEQATAFATERTWAAVADLMDAPKHLLPHLVHSTVGEDTGIEFMAFLNVYASLPTKEEIIAQPKKARVPTSDEISALFSISLMLASVADTQNFGPILEYAGRLPKEFEVMLFNEAATRDRRVCETKAFADWAARNRNLKL